MEKRKYYTRQEMAEALTEAGYKTSPATLATLATRGGGPRYVKYNGRVLYEPEEGFAWAESRVLQSN